MKWMLTCLAAVTVLLSLNVDLRAGSTTVTTGGKGRGGTYMNVGEVRRFPVRFTRGQWVMRNNRWFYIPGTPIFETRTFGTQMKVSNVSVTEHGISLNIKLRKVEPLDSFLTDGGQEVFLYKSKLQMVNGKEHRVLGKYDGRAYLRNVKTRKIVSTPLAGKKKKTDKEKSDAKDETTAGQKTSQKG